jgi:hypothetical protein
LGSFLVGRTIEPMRYKLNLRDVVVDKLVVDHHGRRRLAVFPNERIDDAVEVTLLAARMRQQIALQKRHERIALGLWLDTPHPSRMRPQGPGQRLMMVSNRSRETVHGHVSFSELRARSNLRALTERLFKMY